MSSKMAMAHPILQSDYGIQHLIFYYSRFLSSCCTMRVSHKWTETAEQTTDSALKCIPMFFFIFLFTVMFL